MTAGAVPNGGINRCMVTVVTTGAPGAIPVAAFIATSGPAAVAGGVRGAINNLMGAGAYGGVQYHVIHFTGNAIMINPFGGLFGAVGDYRLAAPRHCAEPKAIEAASATVQQLNGMSTGWWSNSPNLFADPVNNALGHFAVPCDTCRANEAWIMRRAAEARLVAGGVPRRSYDI